ncbi:MAG: hypothetical protein GY855_00165 [candidate division Zixibacteria bacterium]|nr:hypothetical protein [candidate division Zixibacteria bacterium]
MKVDYKTEQKALKYSTVSYKNYFSPAAYNTYPGIYSPWMGISWVASRLFDEFAIFIRYFGYLINEYVFSSIILVGAAAVSIALPSGIVVSAKRVCSKMFLMFAFKRSVDFIGASFGLALALPIFIILPILIKLDSPGPIFFRQLRVGVNRRNGNRRSVRINTLSETRNQDRRRENQFGRLFSIYKFRTMRQDAEKHSGPIWASKNDPRITNLGRFLRHTRLDEIPQLINVIRGEMSLVGPRPERPFFVDKLRKEINSYESRLKVKPGITGLAQVEHGYDQDIEDVKKKVSYDLQYIRQLTILRDFKIMLKTVTVMIAGKGM